MGDSSISSEMVDIVLAEIADGVPLRQIARIHGFGKSSWYRLMEADAEIAGRFARARIDGFDALAEEAIEIADDGRNDWETREREDGTEYQALNHEHVSRSKLRVQTRLDLLARWDPKRYGNATTIKHADADGEKIAMDEVTRAARLAAIASAHNQMLNGDDVTD